VQLDLLSLLPGRRSPGCSGCPCARHRTWTPPHYWLQQPAHQSRSRSQRDRQGCKSETPWAGSRPGARSGSPGATRVQRRHCQPSPCTAGVAPASCGVERHLTASARTAASHPSRRTALRAYRRLDPALFGSAGSGLTSQRGSRGDGLRPGNNVAADDGSDPEFPMQATAW